MTIPSMIFGIPSFWRWSKMALTSQKGLGHMLFPTRNAHCWSSLLDSKKKIRGIHQAQRKSNRATLFPKFFSAEIRQRCCTTSFDIHGSWSPAIRDFRAPSGSFGFRNWLPSILRHRGSKCHVACHWINSAPAPSVLAWPHGEHGRRNPSFMEGLSLHLSGSFPGPQDRCKVGFYLSQTCQNAEKVPLLSLDCGEASGATLSLDLKFKKAEFPMCRVTLSNKWNTLQS